MREEFLEGTKRTLALRAGVHWREPVDSGIEVAKNLVLFA